MKELPWIDRARGYIGLKENTSTKHHNEIIIDMLESMGSFNGEQRAWWDDDETPWCGLFVGYILGISQRFVVGSWYRASAWNSGMMKQIYRPAYGCIVTFTRSGGGHVGFVVGQDKKGNLMVLGGNQKNMVSIAPFSRDRVTGYRWPSKWIDGYAVEFNPDNSRYELPVIDSNGELSINEQ